MRGIHIFNLVGVVALAGLCILQWRRDRNLNHEVNRLEGARIEHEETIAAQGRQISGLQADRDEFRRRFAEADAEAKKTARSLAVAERQVDQLTVEREQLRESVTNWVAAVKQRDAQLEEAAERIRKLAGDLNASVSRFNELATNHNDLVIRFNDLATNRNDIVEKYNALVEQVNKSRGGR